MEKQKLNRFVSKYNLAGLVESVKWEVKSGVLTTAFISDDKSVLGSVSMTGFESDDAVLGIYDTSKLTKMVSVLGDSVDFSVADIDGRPISLKFKDNSVALNYMLADLSVIPNVPDLKKLPEFDSKIKLDSNFISTFIKAKSALSDENTFTFVCNGGSGKIVIGYSNINTNRITIDVDCVCEGGDKGPISFSATYLKEILTANRDAKDATLSISSQGLAHIHFEVDNYTSDYYLVELQG
jgi:DNA polymerase III sliding clamp (beta) subunit (PCNA family)